MTPLLLVLLLAVTAAGTTVVVVRRRRARAAVPATGPVFLDPSGRRWRRISVLGVAVLVPLLVVAGFLAWGTYQPPNLPGGAVPPAVQAGGHLPVVGDGPLLRVLRLDRTGGGAVARDPFTGEPVTLTTAERRAAGSSRYVVERYGYSATARRTIAITLDDGPDAVYTPRMLDMLAAAHVPATFFVTGANAARNPALVARMVREGHAVGNHSLTHADLIGGTDLRARQQMVVTNRILRAETGLASTAFRIPFGGPDVASIRDSVPAILRAQRLGYVVAGYDFDTLDWSYDAGQRKGAIPLPPLDGRNVTLLVHDSGGNRQATITYLRDRLIPAARAAGYTFHTLPQVAPALAASTRPVTPDLYDAVAEQVAQVVFLWPNRLMTWLFLFALSSVVVVGLGGVVLAVVRRRNRPRYPADLPVLPVTVLVAAYNEEKVIARTLATLLRSSYPLLELIVVDDGSTDDTGAQVRAMAETDPRIRLLHQPNAGKWAALNNGLSHARGDIVVTLDADTVFTEDTVGNLVRRFTLDGQERLGAVAGVVRVGNRTRNLLTRWQALEYLTQIGVERAAYAQLEAIPIIPGACAAWRRTAILDAGGYTPSTLAEDCDLTLSLHRAGWRVAQDDEAIAYTEAPDHVDALLAQRIRWTFGTLQAVWKHREMVLRRRYGALGMLVLPLMTASIVVPLVFMPFIFVMAWVAMREQGLAVVLAYLVAFMLVHAFVASVAIVLMRDSWRHLAMVPVYRVIYEPLRAYLLYTSVYLAARGVRMGWNKLQRTGSLDAAVAARAVPAGPVRAGAPGRPGASGTGESSRPAQTDGSAAPPVPSAAPPVPSAAPPAGSAAEPAEVTRR